MTKRMRELEPPKFALSCTHVASKRRRGISQALLLTVRFRRGFWDEVNRELRAAEEKFRPSFRETRAAYITRLRRTAMSVTPKRPRATIGSMTRRCRAVVAAKGGHIDD